MWPRNLYLEDVSDNVIRKLGDVLPIPRVLPGVAFTPQPEPNLKLFLANNLLTRCPKEIFDLTNLTVLSLRRNNLTEIPPAIFQLTNLTELNVSINKLKYLPVDLLELVCSKDCKLVTLNLHPNPFHMPVLGDEQSLDMEEEEAEIRCERRPGWLPRHLSTNGTFEIRLIRRTPAHFLRGGEGKQRESGFRLRLTSGNREKLATEDFSVEPVLPSRAKPTKVLSLMDMCLQTISSTYPSNTDWLEHVQSLEMFRDDPESAENSYHLKTLEDMDAQRQGGPLWCTVCRRKTLRPVAQWIEWYEIFPIFTYPNSDLPSPWNIPEYRSSNESLVPFLRQACTWACVLDRRRGLRWQPGTAGKWS